MSNSRYGYVSGTDSPERERLEMRKKQAILESQREARQLAQARRFRRIRSLTLASGRLPGVRPHLRSSPRPGGDRLTCEQGGPG